MLKYDARNFTDEQRESLAWKVHQAKDFKLPRLTYWNYDLCREHRFGWVDTYYDKATDSDKTRTIVDRPKPGCRKCAIHFRSHQRTGVAWLYLKKRGLLADTMGSGKTTHIGGLIAMLKETGEMPEVGRAVICPRAPALEQWADELHRMMPSLRILVLAGGTPKRKRIDELLGDWEVLLIGPEMLRNDVEQVVRFPLALFAADDIDQLRNDTQTSDILDRVGAHADRYVIASGTPLQKRLGELHSVLDGVGGITALGSRDYFDARYIKVAWVTDFNAKEGKEYRKKQVVGAKNTTELKRKIAPLVLRRTTFSDVNLPTIIPDDVMLDLYPAQRAKYKELQQGVIRILKEEGTEVKHTSAMSRLHYGSAICAGLAALGEPDAPNTSMKMDWLIEKLARGDLSDEKVVVFANLKNTVRALHNRFREEDIGFVTVWGDNKNRAERSAAQRRFWDDPSCQVLLGTRAIEQSLNLQVSRHLVNIDMILNPARMEQLAGRIRRDGSAYQHVFVHNLLTIDSQEERYLPMLEREAALAGHIWDENSQLFQALSPMALLQLISG